MSTQPSESERGQFPATHWSVVRAAAAPASPAAAMALKHLCQTFAAISQPPAPHSRVAPPYISLAVTLTFPAPWVVEFLGYCFLDRLRGGWLIGSWILAGFVSLLLVLWLKPGLPVRASEYGFKIGAWLAASFSLGHLGFGIFFLNALASQGFKWNPAMDEGIIVPLIWLGSLALPICSWHLWPAANNSIEYPQEMPRDARKS